jgi:hypothetical protein
MTVTWGNYQSLVSSGLGKLGVEVIGVTCISADRAAQVRMDRTRDLYMRNSLLVVWCCGRRCCIPAGGKDTRFAHEGSVIHFLDVILPWLLPGCSGSSLSTFISKILLCLPYFDAPKTRLSFPKSPNNVIKCVFFAFDFGPAQISTWIFNQRFFGTY